MGHLATPDDLRLHVAARIEQLGYSDPDGNYTAAIALVWQRQSNPATFDLDDAIHELLAPPTGEFAKPRMYELDPDQLQVHDVLADGGTIVSPPVVHPSGVVVAEVDYVVQRRWPAQGKVTVYRADDTR
jgi:hypothetical protein